MPLFALLLAASTASAPTYSVAVIRRVGVDAARGTELAEAFARGLDQSPGQKLGTLVSVKEFAGALNKGGFPDAAVCAGSAACIANLGKVGGVDRVVALQLVKLGAEIAVDASLVDTRTSESVAAMTRSVSAREPRKPLEQLAAELAAKAPKWEAANEPPVPVAVAGKAPPADAPRKTEPALTPAAAPPPEVGAERPHSPRPLRYASFGLGAAAVVVLGVGAGFGISALGQANAIKPTDADYDSKRQAALNTARNADICYGVAGALAVGAIITFVLSSGDDAAPVTAGSGGGLALHF